MAGTVRGTKPKTDTESWVLGAFVTKRIPQRPFVCPLIQRVTATTTMPRLPHVLAWLRLEVSCLLTLRPLSVPPDIPVTGCPPHPARFSWTPPVSPATPRSWSGTDCFQVPLCPVAGSRGGVCKVPRGVVSQALTCAHHHSSRAPPGSARTGTWSGREARRGRTRRRPA